MIWLLRLKTSGTILKILIVYLEKNIHISNPVLTQNAGLVFDNKNNMSAAVYLYIRHQELIRINELKKKWK